MRDRHRPSRRASRRDPRRSRPLRLDPTGKVSLDHIYTQPDPRPYFHLLRPWATAFRNRPSPTSRSSSRSTGSPSRWRRCACWTSAVRTGSTQPC
ncbi:hypothetical protein NKH18_12470 [Streptomyces sp. M10(2022)]